MDPMAVEAARRRGGGIHSTAVEVARHRGARGEGAARSVNPATVGEVVGDSPAWTRW
jgi:hypothetical protein